MTTDQTSSTRSEEAVVPGDMTDNAADHSTLDAALAGICRAGRRADSEQNRGYPNHHRFHRQVILVLGGRIGRAGPSDKLFCSAK